MLLAEFVYPTSPFPPQWNTHNSHIEIQIKVDEKP